MEVGLNTTMQVSKLIYKDVLFMDIRCYYPFYTMFFPVAQLHEGKICINF